MIFLFMLDRADENPQGAVNLRNVVFSKAITNFVEESVPDIREIISDDLGDDDCNQIIYIRYDFWFIF